MRLSISCLEQTFNIVFIRSPFCRFFCATFQIRVILVEHLSFKFRTESTTCTAGTCQTVTFPIRIIMLSCPFCCNTTNIFCYPLTKYILVIRKMCNIFPSIIETIAYTDTFLILTSCFGSYHYYSISCT